MDFTDKVVLITGASSGIGAACAIRFAKASAKLSIVGRNVENLKKVSDDCEAISGLKPLCIIADITSDDDVQRIVNETIKYQGKIDVLVNNAGITMMAGIQDGIEPYDRVMETNVRGTYLLTFRVIPHITLTRGNIVNVSSILSKTPMPVMMPYCMSKAALDIFTQCLALELAAHGIRVNAVNPGPVRTQFFKKAGLPDEHSEKLLESLAASLPLKKVSEGEDISEMIAFLASDKAKCVTGSSFVVDCGVHLGDPNIKFSM